MRRTARKSSEFFLLHLGGEAARDLPGWVLARPTLPWLAWIGQPGAFVIASGATALALGLAALFAVATGPAWSRLALLAVATIMLLNAASHLALSVMTRSIMPGVVTALLLVTPVMVGVIWASGRSAR